MSTIKRPRFRNTQRVVGGAACIRNRIAAWMLVVESQARMTDPRCWLSRPHASDLDAAWDYYRSNPVEIETSVWFKDTAGNVPDGGATGLGNRPGRCSVGRTS